MSVSIAPSPPPSAAPLPGAARKEPQPLVILADASGLAETVERARALLDDGDVAAARMLAAGVYDQAKAAASFAARFGAAERLVEKARRLQGDALLIEARAKVKLADEYDAAQASGELRKPGERGKAVKNDDSFSKPTGEDLGLSRHDVHDARKLRDAEQRSPGIVERAIAARLAVGLEPSRANLRAAIGTDTRSAAERGNNLYETPGEAIRTLLALERFSPKVLEPACGRGAILRPLENAGYDVLIADLVDYGTADRHGELQAVADFLATTGPAAEKPDIVTNPPYGAVLNAFVAHALRVHRPQKMALLLNLNFLCGFDDPDRNYCMDECPPARVHVFTRRLPMMHQDGWTGDIASSRMNTAWFVWEKDSCNAYAGPTVLRRVDWKDFENAPALGPASPDPLTGSLREPPLPVGERKQPPTPAEERAFLSPTGRGGRKAAGEGANQLPTPLLTWHEPHAGGRIVAKLGTVDIGAVFPEENGKATWAWWPGTVAPPQHNAKSVDMAKTALAKEFTKRTGLPA